MENNKLTQRIEELKPITETSILNRQKYLIPSFVNLNPTLIWDAYQIAGDRFTITGDFKFAVRVSNLPYIEDSINKRATKYFIDNLQNMVNNNEILPIMIFYNNRFIPWSRINIVKDIYVSYILLGGVEDYENIDTIKCAVFPFNLTYIEGLHLEANSNSLLFDENGKLCETNGIVSIASSDQNIFFAKESKEEFNNYELTSLSHKYSIAPFNYCLVFKDGELYPNPKINLNNYGLVTINDGEKADWSIAFYLCLFTNINTNSHQFKVANRNELTKLDVSNAQKLFNNFDFDFSYSKLYETNIADSIRSVMDYDSELMDKIYTNLSMIETVEYTGLEFTQLAKNNYISFNENHKKILDNGDEIIIKIRPIIFVNNILYEHMRGIIIAANNIKVPVVGISKDDKIEILFFKEIINQTYHTTKAAIDKNDIIHSISTEEVLRELDESNLELYTSKSPDNGEVHMTSVDDFDRVQFKVDFSPIHSNDEDIDFEINSGDNIYSGSIPITLASKKQFKYMGFVSQVTRFNFALTPDFNFCLNKNQYMIFINGKKIDQNNFRLVSADPKRPFDDISIYMSMEFSVNDRVDVFYLPVVLREFISAPRIPSSGNIYLDRTKFDYGLNKNMYLIFINGKKIALSEIKNINSSKLHIDTDIQTINDLCILQHIKSQDVLREAFMTNESEWDIAINNLGKDALSKVLNFSNSQINDIEEDFNAWQISDIEIVHEIARDYWLSSRIYEGEPFLYDYDDIVIDGKDIYKTTINRLQNAMIEYYRLYNEHREIISDEELASLAAYNVNEDDYEERMFTVIKSYINRLNRAMSTRVDNIDTSLKAQSSLDDT